jgi:O-acetyl-ADP-ribose deacetylase (regulator of RNase III)
MNLAKREYPGGCFLYYLDPPQKCLAGKLLLNFRELFSSDEEFEKWQTLDCGGEYRDCPLKVELWGDSILDSEIARHTEDDLEAESPFDEEEFEDDEDVEEIEKVEGEIGGLYVDIVYGRPDRAEQFCDALIIPTNTYLRFDDYLPFDAEAADNIARECGMFALPLDLGEVVVTSAGGMEYPFLVHCVVSGLGSPPTDLNAIAVSLFSALRSAAKSKCKSVAMVIPAMVVDGFFNPPADRVLEVVFETINRLNSLDKLESIEALLIYCPPNTEEAVAPVAKLYLSED